MSPPGRPDLPGEDALNMVVGPRSRLHVPLHYHTFAGPSSLSVLAERLMFAQDDLGEVGHCMLNSLGEGLDFDDVQQGSVHARVVRW